jgi:hypothetical protein
MLIPFYESGNKSELSINKPNPGGGGLGILF